MTNPTPLSPAAQAVLDAYMNNCGWLDGPLERDYRCVAALLRAVADQFFFDWNGMCCEEHLKAIANELEAQ